MAKKTVIETTSDIVKKHEATITAMTEAEKIEAIATQLEASEVGDKQKVFYLEKEKALAQQKQAAILAIETARNKAKSDGDALSQTWKDAEATGTWELPVK